MKRFSARDGWFVLLFGAIYTVNFIDRMIISVVGEPIRREFGLSDLQLGVMGGAAFALFYGGIGIPIARLAERVSRIGIVAIATALWSAMTVLSGMAGSYAHLLLARMGVGVGEAGLTPPMVSIIADRFAPERRATVYSLITVGVSLGAAIGALGGGWIAQAHGWRMAFLAMGAPGLLLAALLWLTIPEPALERARGDVPPLGEVLRRVWASRAFVAFTAGSGMVALVGFGLSLFLIPLLVRRFGFDIRAAALTFALALSAATALGGAFGGMLADRIVTNRHARYGLLPMASTAFALPLFLAAIQQDDWRILAILLFAATFCLYAFLPTIMTVTQRLVEPRMRATAAAIHAFGQTVFGLAVGSALLGWMSDYLAARAYGAGYKHDCLVVRDVIARPACDAASGKGLQQALLLLGLFLLLAIASFWSASRSIAGEIVDGDRDPRGAA
ncbi:MAG: MFS transporter [Sphingomonadales bacterium]|nr:MFS transporter [Sphingomonadales bacterium]MDE2569492.1 MFS transporter [Sphingomonadales bacterium]